MEQNPPPKDPAAPGPLLQVGQKVGNYRVVGLLGQGGMGAVFEAVHDDIERRAAIKVLHPDLSQNPQFAGRFKNEARAVNLIKHPGLVEIFEFGILEGGTAFIIMEYLEGESLGRRIERERGQLDEEALFLCRQIAQALAAAHHKGIVHRDLKPDNIMLIPDVERPGRWRTKVLDFGIAKVSGPAEGSAHTETGTTVGTPAYMAPEQCLSAPTLDGKADVYALGVICYEMLSGRLPFDAQHGFDFMAAHVRVAPRPLREVAPGIPEELAALVHDMLAKRPEERPTMAAVVGRLDALRGTLPPRWTTPPFLRTDGSLGRSGALALGALTGQRARSEALAATMQAPSQPASPAHPPPRRRWGRALLMGLVVATLLGALAVARRRGPAPAPAATPAAPIAPPPVAPVAVPPAAPPPVAAPPAAPVSAPPAPTNATRAAPTRPAARGKRPPRPRPPASNTGDVPLLD